MKHDVSTETLAGDLAEAATEAAQREEIDRTGPAPHRLLCVAHDGLCGKLIVHLFDRVPPRKRCFQTGISETDIHSKSSWRRGLSLENRPTADCCHATNRFDTQT